MLDYKSFWKKEAAPKLMALPADQLQLIWRVHTEASNIKPDRSLTLEWASSSLEEEFHSQPSGKLAYTAHIFQHVGHFHPGYPDWIRPLVRSMTYWRFCLYADRTLRNHLGIQKSPNIRGSFQFEIAEGVLRACIRHGKKWQAVSVGLADLKTKLAIDSEYKKILARYKLNESSMSEKPDVFKTQQVALQQAKLLVGDDRLLDLSKYSKNEINSNN